MKTRKEKELLKELDELFDIVWWNRHMHYRYNIDLGIEAPPTIENWEGVKQMADKMVDKYGIERLELDDFEWGMVNGRLACLRWVLGDEYSNLDT